MKYGLLDLTLVDGGGGVSISVNHIVKMSPTTHQGKLATVIILSTNEKILIDLPIADVKTK